jgi:hypothetical protein
MGSQRKTGKGKGSYHNAGYGNKQPLPRPQTNCEAGSSYKTKKPFASKKSLVVCNVGLQIEKHIEGAYMPIIIGNREELEKAYLFPTTQRQSRTYKWFRHSEVKNMGIKTVKELIKEISFELNRE